MNDNILIENLVESAKIIIEGGNAFDDVGNASKQDIKYAYNHIKKILDKNVFDINKISGLGSTRKIINNINTKKSSFGDIDLLITTHSSYDRKDGIESLKRTLNTHSIDFRTFFGNLFTCRFPMKDRFVQVDLMVIGGDKGDGAYSYIHDLLYFSDEPDDNNLKGAHRTELVKSWVKVAGLRTGASELKKYKFDDSIRSINDARKLIAKTLKRARNEVKKQSLLSLDEIIQSKFKSISNFKKMLTTKEGYLKNFFDRQFKGINAEVIIKLFFIEERLTDDWRDVLTHSFGTPPKGTWEKQLRTTVDVLDMLSELYKKRKIQKNQIISIFTDYKVNVSNYWNETIERLIVSKFEFMNNKLS